MDQVLDHERGLADLRAVVREPLDGPAVANRDAVFAVVKDDSEKFKQHHHVLAEAHALLH